MLSYFHIGNCTTQIVMFGDSLVAGYGLPPKDALPQKLEDFLNKEGMQVKVVNAGISGDTTADGVSRLNYITTLKPEYVIIVLGGNDMLRNWDPSKTNANLETIIKTLKENGIKVILTKIEAALNYGPAFKKQFDSIFPTLAKKYNIETIPFFMVSVVSNQSLMLFDGIHPNSKGVDEIVKEMGPLIKKIIEG